MATSPTPRPRESRRDVVELELRDGGRIWVRPIRPTDRVLLEEGLRRLSPRSRYLRFHTHKERFSESQLAYLTEVDHHDHEALIAIDPDADGDPGVGVARYIRLADEPTIAEAAVTVLDEYQGRGIGTALIGRLELLARDRGIDTFRNYVLAENKAMLQIFKELDGRFEQEDASLYRVDVPIPEDGDAQPDTPAGQWVRSVGRAETPSRTSFAFPLLWLVRQVTDEAPKRLLKLLADDGVEEDDEEELGAAAPPAGEAPDGEEPTPPVEDVVAEAAEVEDAEAADVDDDADDAEAPPVS